MANASTSNHSNDVRSLCLLPIPFIYSIIYDMSVLALNQKIHILNMLLCCIKWKRFFCLPNAAVGRSFSLVEVPYTSQNE